MDRTIKTVYLLAFTFMGFTTYSDGFVCDRSATECETSLKIEHRLTMMHKKKAVYPFEGKLYNYDVTNVSSATPVNVDEVITADGWEENRLVVVANESLPGPSIIVYEGQVVIIHVTNKLLSDTVSIHWHGLPQHDTPYMDGVGMVTQCPILPYQTFTYRFKAEPKGTYWYHAHVGTQRNKGLHGAFVIRSHEDEPTHEQEHIMTVGDWNHDWDADMDHARMAYGFYEDRKKYISSQSLDGSFFSNFYMQSGLLNGRGRFYNPETGKHNGAPLEVFEVKNGKQYRFRVIGTGALYPFRVSIDNHEMTIIASDGYDLEPLTAQSFVINPGERFDIIITANQSVSNYWIRAKTLETTRDHHVEAILRYMGAPEEEPTTSDTVCHINKRCLVVNCPFSFYPQNEFTDCITFDKLKANATDDPAPGINNGKFQEFFMNFGFTPGTNSWPSGVNGRSFVTPGVSALSQPKELQNPCSEADCGEQKTCFCTQSVSFHHGNTIQIILSNMGKASGWAHPVHMHGHTFYVLKMGYPSYNRTTGIKIEDNLDVDCRGGTSSRKDSYCNDPTWSNATWYNGNIPDLEIQRPPRKDTLIIPSGAYAVIRIKADNPGVWLMHCHIKLHFSDGMAILLNESFPHQPPPPKGFPLCYDYPRRYIEERSDKTTQQPEIEKVTDDGMFTSASFWTAVGMLIAVAFIEFLIIAYMCLCTKRNTKSKHLVSRTNYAYNPKN